MIALSSQFEQANKLIKKYGKDHTGTIDYKFNSKDLLSHDISSLGVIMWIIMFKIKVPWIKNYKYRSNINNKKSTLFKGMSNNSTIVNISSNGEITVSNSSSSNSNNDRNSLSNNNPNKLISNLIISCMGKIDNRPSIDEVIEKLTIIRDKEIKLNHNKRAKNNKIIAYVHSLYNS